jgi:DNA-binding transcriptional MerR regulator
MLHTAVEARGKSAEAFRTISEVAADLDVPQHVLRFWEGRFSQIRPVKRAGGRRYYRPDDVDLLRGIRVLLYGDGLTIKGVQKILRDHGVRYVIDIGRGKTSLLGHRGNGKLSEGKSATAVSFDVVPRAAKTAPREAARPKMAVSHETDKAELGPESRARLEIRLAELLDLKRQLIEARPAVS